MPLSLLITSLQKWHWNLKSHFLHLYKLNINHYEWGEVAGSFTLCRIALLISVGLKPLLSPGRGFLRPLAKQEVLWEAGWVEEGLGLANGGVGPVKRRQAKGGSFSDFHVFSISWLLRDTGVPQSPWVSGILGCRRHHYSQWEAGEILSSKPCL